MPIDLTGLDQPTQTPYEPIDLTEIPIPKPMPEELVQQRTKKFHAGMSEVLGRSEEYITNALRNGREQDLRDELATSLNMREVQRRQDTIAKLAKERNAPFNTQELKTLMQTPPPFDPESAPEKEYTKFYMSVLDNPAVAQEPANLEEANYAGKVRNGTAWFAGRNEQIRTFVEDAKAAYEGQGYLGWGADRAKELLSLGLYSNIKQRSNTPETGFFNGLLGTNKQEQYKELFRMPDATFNETLKKARQMIADNPGQAVEWGEAMLGMSASQISSDNFWNFLDIAQAPGVGLGAKAISKGFGMAVKNGAKDVLEQVVKDGSGSRVTAHAAAGDIESSGVELAKDTVLRGIRHESSTRDLAFENMDTALRSDANLIANASNPGKYGAEQASRLVDDYNQKTDTFLKTVMDRVNVARADVETAFREGFQNLLDETKDKYPGIRNSILDLKLHYNQSTNTHDIEMVVGKFNAELFSSFSQAQQFARANGIVDYSIKSQGARWYLSVKTPLVETEGWGKQLFAKTKAQEAPDTFLSSLLGKFRNPDETLSFSQRESRLAGTYGFANILKILKDEAQLIRPVANNPAKREQFTRFLNAMKDDAESNGRKGLWLDTPFDVESKYMSMFGRLADTAEVDAYFAYKRATEYDRQFRTILMYRNMSRAGVQEHVFTTVHDLTGDKLVSPSVKGIKMDHLPATEDSILYLNKHNAESRLFDAIELKTDPKLRKDYEKMLADIESGRRQVIRVFNPEERPLANYTKAGDHYVRYVVAPSVETKNIDYNGLIPRRGGGHFVYDHSEYLKQARVIPERVGSRVTHNYEGDTTIAAFSIRALGKEVGEHLDKVRQLLLKAAEEGRGNRHTKARLQKDAKAFFESKPVEGLSWKEVKGWFQTKKLPDGTRVPPRLGLREPIQLVGRDKKLVNVDNGIKDRYTITDSSGKKYSTFRDATKSGSDNMQLQVQFTGQRDDAGLFTIKNDGTRQNPLYKKVAAQYLDPLTTMDRTYGNIAKSLWMDDYKIKSVENWLAQAQKYLKADANEVNAAPFHFFHASGDKSAFKPDAPPELVRNMTTAHMQIQQFLGIRTEVDNLLHSAAQRVADSLYNSFGEKGLKIDPLWLLPKLKDPFQFMRSIAFHAKLGLFAVPQLLLQAQTYSVMMGMAGIKNTTQALAAASMTQLTRINKNPSIVNHLDKLMSKMGWRPGEFAESLNTLHRTGFMDVGREYALRGDIEAPKLITTRAGRVLDAGTVFFTEGERFTRIGAWHIAYKEFREANPFGRVTDKDIRAMLVRADDLTVNMSRASSSMLHSGAMSVPSQFLTYQIRLAELMWGKRLSAEQRMKVLGYQSLLYGVPVGLSVTGLPLGDYFRKAALENNYVVGDNWLNTAITEGLPATMIALATGGGDMKKGNFYNIGDRYGPKGLFSDLLRGDKTMWDIIGGAGFSVSKGIWDGSDGFRQAMLSLVRGDSDKKVKLSSEDIMDVFKEVTSVNQVWKSIAALNTGRWYSKKEGYLSDVSPLSAIFMGITGTQPQDVTDLQLMSWSNKDRKKFEDEVEKNVIQEIRRAIRIRDENPDQSDKYMSRAKALFEIADFPINRRTDIIAKAAKDHESLIDSMDWNFYRILDADTQTQQRFDALNRKRQIKELRGKN